MKNSRKKSKGDLQLLSAYLDGQLTDTEKRRVDDLLLVDQESRQSLALLKHTCALLRSLPVHKVPRNFTLSAQPKPTSFIPSFNKVFRFSSAAAAFLLVAALALDFFQKPSQLLAARSDEEIHLSAQAEEKSAAIMADELPIIINWGAPVQAIGAYGKGGGGTADAFGMGGGGDGEGFSGIGGGSAEPLTAPADLLPSDNAPLVEEPVEAETVFPEPEITAQLPEAKTLAETILEPQPLTGSGPILGVREPEVSTAVVIADEPVESELIIIETLPLRQIEMILAILLVFTAIPAWLLRKN